ncbi:HAD family hydrolase [Desulfobaculum bizertense]|uniref:Putative hydrolase of the HAD superfamily n=1 Tax=Desulfobaculum bizertense DSM 18034 TaxID=1121442 RepID=A0A1T4VNT3_9BACT|nr:HAD family phosphatase [Desulfobaculum bizertense]SKA66642.1 putative hydrolase of the HAD superfamily [Desulfobaculum bizertense DSM 18034]
MSASARKNCDAVIFDFGGVLAEEGFFNGFMALGERYGKDGKELGDIAVDIVRKDGFAVGRIDEKEFWTRFRERTGISDSDAFLRHEILSRFIIRDFMFAYVEQLSKAGYKVAILSDQTNWLDEMNESKGFYRFFDVVHNSYRTGTTKKELKAFTALLEELDLAPERALFVDDFAGHIRRAQSLGLKTILYTDRESFEKEFLALCPDLGKEQG